MEEIHKELTLTRVFDAPRETVWKYWTDKSLLEQWWGPSGVTAPVVEMDVKPGGKIYIVMKAGPDLGQFAGQEWPMSGTYQTVEEPQKIVYTSEALLNDKPFLETLTTVTLEEENGKTTMTVHIVVTKAVSQAATGALAGMEMGWNQQLDKLVAMVAKK